MSVVYVLARIQAIQRELDELKRTIASEGANFRRKTELKGLWKGVKVNEEDMKEAQRAVFKNAYACEG